MYSFESYTIIVQGVFDVNPLDNGLVLKEIADGVSMQDVVEKTGCEFKVSASNRRYTRHVALITLQPCRLFRALLHNYVIAASIAIRTH